MQARRAVVDWAQKHVEDRAILSDIALAITEATTNVVLHAYRDRPIPGSINIKAERLDDHLCLYVLDILSQLWCALYLQPVRGTSLLSAQAEYQARILPALAAQLVTETTSCSHAPAFPYPGARR